MRFVVTGRRCGWVNMTVKDGNIETKKKPGNIGKRAPPLVFVRDHKKAWKHPKKLSRFDNNNFDKNMFFMKQPSFFRCSLLSVTGVIGNSRYGDNLQKKPIKTLRSKIKRFSQ